MGPKEMMMIGVGILVLVAVTFVVNWAKNRSSTGGNNVNTKSQ